MKVHLALVSFLTLATSSSAFAYCDPADVAGMRNCMYNEDMNASGIGPTYETSSRPNPVGGYDYSNGIQSRANPSGGFTYSNGVTCVPNPSGGVDCH